MFRVVFDMGSIREYCLQGPDTCLVRRSNAELTQEKFNHFRAFFLHSFIVPGLVKLPGKSTTSSSHGHWKFPRPWARPDTTENRNGCSVSVALHVNKTYARIIHPRLGMRVCTCPHPCSSTMCEIFAVYSRPSLKRGKSGLTKLEKRT